MRNFIESDELKKFVIENPQINFEFFVKRSKHPTIYSTYLNGFNKDVSVKNCDPEEILKFLF